MIPKPGRRPATTRDTRFVATLLNRAIVWVNGTQPSSHARLNTTGLTRCDRGARNVSTVRHNAKVLLDELVKTSEAVAATSSRRAKVEAIARLLRRAECAEVPVAVAFLSGELRQRQIGVGYAALRDIAGEQAAGEEPPTSPPLTLTAVDAAFAQIGMAVGPGSQAERRRLLTALFSAATRAERSFLVRLLAGDLRQGALEGVMVEAIAAAAGVGPGEVRRAHMLGGSLLAVAAAALTPSASALEALRSFRLMVGRPLQPMLASSADSVVAALARIRPAAVEWKIDGIRVQVHKDGGDVTVFTRTLDDVTSRVPEVVAAARAVRARSAVLDGEIVALGEDGRPRPFQITAGRTGARTDILRLAVLVPLTTFFFDLLYVDGNDLVDSPGAERYVALANAVPGNLVIPRIVPAHPRSCGDRRRVGSWSASRLAVQPASRRTGARDRRARDAGQDIQGSHRPDSRLADRAPTGACGPSAQPFGRE